VGVTIPPPALPLMEYTEVSTDALKAFLDQAPVHTSEKIVVEEESP